MLNYPGHDFLGIFTSGRYYKDMKILKILASNSKQIDDDRGGGHPKPTIS